MRLWRRERTPTEAGDRRTLGSLLRPQLVGAGLLGGVLSGLMGVGGGLIMVPLLVLWSGFRQRDAHAFSLGAIIPISLVGSITYGVAGEVKVLPALLLAAGSLVGAPLGARALARADEQPLKLAFGIFLLIAAVLMVVHP